MATVILLWVLIVCLVMFGIFFLLFGDLIIYGYLFTTIEAIRLAFKERKEKNKKS